LIGAKAGKLRFDYAVYEDNELFCFIECQGQQHTYPVEYFGGQTKFEQQQIHDEIKREYARMLGVPLLEIPFSANSYEKIAQLLQQFGI